MRAREPVIAYLGLGSSLGDRAAHLRFALTRLEELPRQTSGDRPASMKASPPAAWRKNPFLNSVVEIETALAPADLLREIHQIEKDAGRVRAVHGEDRTLDIDILLYGDRVIRDGGLQIPHPRLHERRFVLAPLADLAPDLVIPGLLRPVAELLRRVPGDASPFQTTLP
ncbi:MAG: 2-amino-4-hydroxy-6-hydroxymethyldihydropteridine diphosphokinase [Deltaproteobacteria bacterium]|nr:2-amino-4-hydroxy-6-hydroxymethyldihydropteridine diphosphokinase [Deltaproteobacteria bacterium]